MTTVPNFRTQGLLTSDHHLGAAMSQSARPERALPRLYSSEAVTSASKSLSYPPGGLRSTG
jgi:hypothetical protein